MIPSAGHFYPASETQPPDAFVLMRQNPRHSDPSKPRGNSSETQPPDAFVLPKLCSKLCCQNSPIATVDDGAIGPTMPAANVDLVFLEVPLLYMCTFLSLFSKVACRESAQCYSRYQELKENQCEVIHKQPEHHTQLWQLLQIQPRYCQAVTKLLLS